MGMEGGGPRRVDVLDLEGHAFRGGLGEVVGLDVGSDELIVGVGE